MPLVAVGCGTRAPLDSVAIDNISGAFQATRYLLDLGHETVHYVGGPDSTLDARERAEGLGRALREAGTPEPEIVRGDWSARSGYEIGHELARMPEVTRRLLRQRPDGARHAPGARRARAPGPADVSVVGFDDIPESAFFLPPLTTVRQDFGELGKQALRLLVDRICGRPAPGARMPVAPELIVRASATRPPGADRAR